MKNDGFSRGRACRGMTLIELLIAVVLTAIAALVVAQAFAAGFRVWHRASQLGGNFADSIMALESFQQDVRNTLPCRQVAFRGGGNWLEIPALMGAEELSGRQPGLIRYDFDVAGQRLERLFKTCEIAGGRESSRREVMAGGVRSITFLYAEPAGPPPATLVWQPAWEGHTNNPAAVKVKWQGQQGEEIFEFERTILLPCR